MTTSYPGALDSYAAKADGVDDVLAAHVNDLQDAVVAIETELGTQPRHSAAGAPTVNDDSGDGYSVGTMWVDTTNDQVYVCVDNTLTAAVWRNLTSKLVASDGSPDALTADAAGALTSGAGLTMAGNIVLGDNNLAGNTVTMEDDTATSFTPGNAYGILLLHSTTVATLYAMASYRTVATIFMQAMVTGTDVEFTTGVLEGTTGNDAKFTISCHTDGKIYLENRLGGTRYIRYVLLSK